MYNPFKNDQPFKSSKRIITKHRVKNISNGFHIFAIANIFLWFGLIARLSITQELPLPPSLLFQLDIGIIFLLILIGSFAGDPLFFVMLLLGWTIAGLYARDKYGSEASKIVFNATLVAPAVFSILFIFLVGPVFLGFGSVAIFSILFLIFLIGIVLVVTNLILAIPAFIVTNFKMKSKNSSVVVASYPNYLVLLVGMLTNPDEKVSHCPFRNKNEPGCAFLGYKAPNLPLICDYVSTFTICNIYRSLYHKVEFEGAANK